MIRLIALCLLLWCAAASAGQKDPRLDTLFTALKNAASDADAALPEQLIWRIWLEQPDPEAARILRRGMLSLSAGEAEDARAAFDEVVKREPDFAEGWNKRATVEFLMGDFDASVADIERTLALEPRHFGALSGLGQIYLALDRKPQALKAFQAALAIDPHLANVRETVERLKRDLEGAPI